MRYTYLGDAMTDPALVGKRCDPVRRADGKCIVSTRMASQLVIFEGEDRPRVVKRRRLRITDALKTPVLLAILLGFAACVAGAAR